MAKYIAVRRVSSIKQEGNQSFDSQTRQIELWALANNAELIWVEPIVESATCTLSERPLFQQALDKMHELDCDGLVVYHFDRFFRNTEEGLRTARVEFQEKGKTLVSASQNIDLNDDNGWFMFVQFLAFAENEARRMKSRFREGKTCKRSKGGYLGGEAPYGWMPDGDGGLIENEAEQSTRQLILSMFAEEPCRSMNSVAEELNYRKIPTRKGKQWTAKQIESIRSKAEALAAVS